MERSLAWMGIYRFVVQQRPLLGIVRESVQQRRAQQVESADGPVEQGADDRLGGRIPRQFVQVALEHEASSVFAHGPPHRPQGGYIGANSPALGAIGSVRA
jgi:hypothetical protein